MAKKTLPAGYLRDQEKGRQNGNGPAVVGGRPTVGGPRPPARASTFRMRNLSRAVDVFKECLGSERFH